MTVQDFSEKTKRFNEKPYDAPAYLIRFWRGAPDEPWRALARRVADGQEVVFVSPEDLFSFLSAQITEEPAAGKPDVAGMDVLGMYDRSPEGEKTPGTTDHTIRPRRTPGRW